MNNKNGAGVGFTRGAIALGQVTAKYCGIGLTGAPPEPLLAADSSTKLLTAMFSDGSGAKFSSPDFSGISGSRKWAFGMLEISQSRGGHVPYQYLWIFGSSTT